MIAKDKEVAAMKALQAVLIRGRTMGYTKDDHAKIADLLDVAEYLAGMLYEQPDTTEIFRENLVMLAERHQCGVALTKFDAVRVLKLGKYGRARVWIRELPGAAYPSAKTFTHAVAAVASSENKLMLAAVEVFVPVGPRSMYGLLGGQWTSGTTNQLSVDVSIAAADGQLFSDNLAGKGDEVRVGLPAEYAQAVLAGVDLAKSEMNTLAAGKLSINCAAHGAIGSCEAVYKHLAVILVKLLNAASVEPSDDELVKLFPPTFS